MIVIIMIEQDYTMKQDMTIGGEDTHKMLIFILIEADHIILKTEHARYVPNPIPIPNPITNLDRQRAMREMRLAATQRFALGRHPPRVV